MMSWCSMQKKRYITVFAKTQVSSFFHIPFRYLVVRCSYGWCYQLGMLKGALCGSQGVAEHSKNWFGYFQFDEIFVGEMTSCWSFCPSALMFLMFLPLQDRDGNQWVYIYLLIINTLSLLLHSRELTNQARKSSSQTIKGRLGRLFQAGDLSNPIKCYQMLDAISFASLTVFTIGHIFNSIPSCACLPNRLISRLVTCTQGRLLALSKFQVSWHQWFHSFTPNISWLASGQPCSHNSSWPAANFLLVRAAAYIP